MPCVKQRKLLVAWLQIGVNIECEKKRNFSSTLFAVLISVDTKYYKLRELAVTEVFIQVVKSQDGGCFNREDGGREGGGGERGGEEGGEGEGGGGGREEGGEGGSGRPRAQDQSLSAFIRLD